MLSLIPCCLISICSAAPTLNLQINSDTTDGNNFYSVNVNNEQWLQSGQLEGYFNDQWYTSNATKASTDQQYTEMNLISSSILYDRFDDFGGGYSYYIFQWLAGTVIFETNFKIYNDGGAISFVQKFPNGAKGTNLMSASLPTGCGGDSYEIPPFLSFPSFNVINKTSQYAMGNLGYLTWTETFSTAKWGKTPVINSDLDGINGGPVVLYDNSSLTAIIVSTNDNFGVSTQLNQLVYTPEATFMNDSDRNDSLFCINWRCYAYNTQYQNKRIQGISTSPDDEEDVIELHLWYSGKCQDNYVATIAYGPPENSSYNIILGNGYIYKNNDADGSRLALELYYNEERMDHATVATQDLKDQLKAMGYIFNATLGYISYNTPPPNDWRLGISSQVLEVPQGFEHETVIVVGNGINDVVLTEWSSRIQSKYHTSKLDGDKDIVTSYLGYWTDNGAYYYGDSWSGATGNPLNLTCCSLDVFKQVKAKLDAMKIPIRYWQMDDWWYIGLHPSEYHLSNFGGVRSVQHWEPPEQYYPGGLAALSDGIQVPLLLYGPYFAPDNDWIGQFTFIPQGAGYVLPSPQDSYDFYSALMEFGINASTTGPNTGMIGYEVDFMSCLSGIPEFRMKIGAEQQWLDGMNKAAEERGISIQFCMATPMDLMQSLSLSQVTNGRASSDYAASDNWDIGTGSLLWSGLGLKPSKDNMWTSMNEVYSKDNHPNGDDHNSTEIHAIISIMSCGPVGISDGIGYSNNTLIMRLCRSDGRLLQPIRPITAINHQFIENVFNGNNNINIWSTEFGPYDSRGINVEIIGHIVLAINMKENYKLKYNSFTPPLNNNFMYIIRNWHNYTNCINGTFAIKNDCIQLIKPNSNILYTVSSQSVIPPMIESFELIHIIQDVSLSSIIFLGELDKYVSISQHRFNNLIIEGSSLSVTIKGEANENVFVSVLIPITTNYDWNFYTFNVVIGSNGNTQFNLSIDVLSLSIMQIQK